MAIIKKPTIRKRMDGRFAVRIKRPGQPNVVKILPSLSEARAWLADYEIGQWHREKHVSARVDADISLHDALERYAHNIVPGKKGAPQELCRIRHWQRHPLALQPLVSLQPSDMSRYRDWRVNTGRMGDTVRLDLAVISHLFSIAQSDWGLDNLVNPVKRIRKPKLARGRDRRLSPDEETRLLEHYSATGKKRLAAIHIIAVETAMRRSEIVSLRWDDVDLHSQVARLRDTKNGTAREVPLSRRAVATLNGLSRKYREVFSIDKDWITYEFRQSCKALGIVDLRFHDLRHEATSRFFEKGLNVVEVATITGHKSLQMLKRYTHLKASDLAKRLG